MQRQLGSVLLIMAVAISLAAASQNAPKKERAEKESAAVQDFEARVTQYLQQRKDKAGILPRPTSSAAKLADTREQLRERIWRNRAQAQPGDIFTPKIAAYFHRQIANVFAGARGARILTSLRRAEPLKGVSLQVNQPYPDGLPLQSTPPTLLLKLPKLPRELQYRIVGRNLVLLDIEPNLVVDILPDAIPAA